MYIERLTRAQINLIVEKIIEPYCYLLEKNFISALNCKSCVEVQIYEKEYGFFWLTLSDARIHSTAALKELAEIEKNFIRIMYKIFGEEYKDYYMKQVNEIFA